MIETISLASIIKDSDLQMRVAMNEQAVADYADVIRNTPLGEAVPLPPVVLFRDKKKLYLVDGFHRHEGHVRAGAAEIQALIMDGTKRDAILYSVGANSDHGLRRTNDDKRKAVVTLLSDKEWSTWSDRDIARRASVSHTFVAGLRSQFDVTGNVASEKTYTTKHGTEAVMKTANIGKSPAINAAADRAEAKADERRRREEKQAENDKARDDAREALPDTIKSAETAKAEAIERRKALSANDADAADDRIAELEEANASLEAEVRRLSDENKLYSEMKAEFDAGGFAEVIAGKDEVIRGQKAIIEKESADKASWMRSSKRWEKRAKEAGWSDEAVIDLREVTHA